MSFSDADIHDLYEQELSRHGQGGYVSLLPDAAGGFRVYRRKMRNRSETLYVSPQLTFDWE